MAGRARDYERLRVRCPSRRLESRRKASACGIDSRVSTRATVDLSSRRDARSRRSVLHFAWLRVYHRLLHLEFDLL